ncbi:hypothetical protein HRR81_003977 [Exophiala dermatitidis]|uniref:BTB domain-containing protein n=2 Tax=Exophiala dermatitidis TaxID=5970 RepID=H6C243_EXODN|nr:uncharacterized protein HMPREF1120_06679 [Exophiala dermatitidis NIH/UT8656]KAJ4508459.1 hypothetical protein HRR75_006280 [Exophiala dermatitidis]EHY58675.1 hypothetical protein HMPREF1120_06679 [Exophiala dermatitidis NIH/UT8656]KAJ4510695.1 hypothetical protein HRR73_006767 [Exophiala dermatitidis]KAJ4575840.1 hypothetical protein HRR82_006133 [Exophiala dermatitidis]KAJ4576089.1 hypothetical protein HRR81_003977 [Exophiala dermatitidis]
MTATIGFIYAKTDLVSTDWFFIAPGALLNLISYTSALRFHLQSENSTKMFVSRKARPSDSFASRYGTSKSIKPRSSHREHSITRGLQGTESVKHSRKESNTTTTTTTHTSPPVGSTLTSAIITICVGPEQRLFAGHEEVLCRSPFFEAALRGQFFDSNARRINLPHEQPEILSAVLEYLYKGDYYPRLIHNKKRDTWELEDAGNGNHTTIFCQAVKQTLMKDTVIYCSAERYGLDELKRLALRKQGLRQGMQISTILASARYAYKNTPDSDSKLRAQYLTLIIRSRNNFKKSGTMKVEMEQGGTALFFDLFVAMCNHMDDLKTVRSPFSSPFTR